MFQVTEAEDVSGSCFSLYSDRLGADLVLLIYQQKGQRGSGPKHLENHPSRIVFLTPLVLLTKEMGG